jgi:hypothetical protein
MQDYSEVTHALRTLGPKIQVFVHFPTNVRTAARTANVITQGEDRIAAA